MRKTIFICLLVLISFGGYLISGAQDTGLISSWNGMRKNDEVTAEETYGAPSITTITFDLDDDSAIFITIKFNDISPSKAVQLTKEISKLVYKYGEPCQFDIRYNY